VSDIRDRPAQALLTVSRLQARVTKMIGGHELRDGRQLTSSRWRAALKRIASGPLLGFICLAMAPVVTAVCWGIVFRHVGWNVLLYAVGFAAIALNASAWLAAILFGRTRQLRASWCMLVAALGALLGGAAVWPDSANDFLLVIWTTLFILGFPSSIIFKIAASQGLFLGAAMVGLLASAYLQPFVLLPWLFRWRLKPEADQAQALRS
jgi:hypothetical protein